MIFNVMPNRLTCIKTALALWLVLSLASSGCSRPEQQELSIALNPWPGHELLYLAKELGYFRELGLDVRLVELHSLSDSQRAYMSGQVDGLTSTLVEAVLIQVDSAYPLQVVLPTDYSNGGDVILAQAAITSLEGLKGKRVGCEANSLGIHVLHHALHRAGLSLDDVEVVNVGQAQGREELALGVLDALVTYPPTSIEGLKVEGVRKLFTSREVPEEILDVLSIKQSVLERYPALPQQLLTAWQRAYEYTEQNPKQAFAIMAEREQISVEEFEHMYNNEIHVFDKDGALNILRDWSSLTNKLMETCEVLKEINQHNSNCSRVHTMVNRETF